MASRRSSQLSYSRANPEYKAGLDRQGRGRGGRAVGSRRRGQLDLEWKLTSSGLIRSGTVQPSRSYSAMHCSAKPL